MKPDFLQKDALGLAHSAKKRRQVIAASIPNSGLVNIPDAPDVNFWPTHINTVRDLELNTGLDLLSNLPDEIEEIVETTPYSGRTST